MKLCKKCGLSKALNDFYLIKNGRSAGRYHTYCKSCENTERSNPINNRKHDPDLNIICKICNKNITSSLFSSNSKYMCKKCYNLEIKTRKYKVTVAAKINPSIPLPIEKICVTCNKTKLLEQFRKSPRSTHGYTNICIVCYNIYMRSARSRRKALKRNSISIPYTTETIFIRDKGICQECGKQLDESYWHLDHYIPLSKGGSDTPDNVRVTCPHCNLSKKDKIPDGSWIPAI